MSFLTLNELKTEIDKLAEKIRVPVDLLPDYGYCFVDAHPYLEVDARGYHYVVKERGQENERMTTGNLDELLYCVFQDVTLQLAMDYEFAHRIESQDGRRIVFRLQNNSLSLLSPKWAERTAQRQAEILKQYPFDDDINLRLDLRQHYCDQGLSSDSAQQKACEQYPLPPNYTPNPTGPYR